MRTSKEIRAEINAIKAEDKKYNSLVNEGGYGYQRDSVPSKLWEELYAAEAAEFAAEWTPEVTAERRAEWNVSVKRDAKGGTIRSAQVRAIEAKVGFTMADLKKAVALNDQ